MLNQVQLTTANATILFAPPKRMIFRIESLIVANYGGVVTNLSLYHDNNGTTSDNTTVIMSAVPFGINLFRVIPIGIYMNNLEGGGGSLIATAAAGNIFTLTLYGTEIK